MSVDDPFFGEEGEEPGAEAFPVFVPAAGGPLEPVRIEHVMDHRFEKKEGGKRGCARCGGAKALMTHVGAPPSMNVGGSGWNQFVFQSMKKAWMDMIRDLLRAAGLPRGLGGVLVEGEVTFPTRAKRDQGNFRFLVEKACGDALVTGGWIVDDDWDHYEFGNLAKRYERGVSATALMFLPRWAEPAEGSAAQESLGI